MMINGRLIGSEHDKLFKFSDAKRNVCVSKTRTVYAYQEREELRPE